MVTNAENEGEKNDEEEIKMRKELLGQAQMSIEESVRIVASCDA